MGTSTDGILAYGYDLDGQDGLNAVEAQPREKYGSGYLKTSWYDEEAEGQATDEDGDELSLIEILEKRLYDAIPDAPEARYSWQRDDLVKTHYGVWFESHCSGDYPMYILATHAVTAHRGHPKTLDFAALEAQRVAEDWDGRLTRALAILEVTPLKPAAWLLASDWG